jgi:hypothetical protein
MAVTNLLMDAALPCGNVTVNVDPSMSQRAIYYRSAEQDPVDAYVKKSLRQG